MLAGLLAWEVRCAVIITRPEMTNCCFRFLIDQDQGLGSRVSVSSLCDGYV